MLPHVAARLFNTPLIVDPAKAVAIVAGIGGRLVDGELVIDGPSAADHLAFSMGRPSEQLGVLDDQIGRRYDEEEILNRIGPIAVISVEGTLVHKGGWVGARSGQTSYQGIQAQVLRAARDDRVRGVVLEIDSFGGEIAGAFDTAEMIAELSAIKPTVAILTDFALSGGYLLASAARQIVLPETGAAGSIGVIAMHVDFSRAIENEGMRVTVIKSGARKDDGSPFKPLDDEVRARWQRELDAGRELFAATVARYRGRRLSKKAALETEADIFRGEDAVSAGLADAVARPSLAVMNFVARMRG